MVPVLTQIKPLQKIRILLCYISYLILDRVMWYFPFKISCYWVCMFTYPLVSAFFSDILTLKYGFHMLSRNSRKKAINLHRVTSQKSKDLKHRGQSLQSRFRIMTF